MEEQKQDAIVDSSTTQEVVNVATDQQQTQEPQPQETVQPSTVGQPQVDLDEQGVPYKNRAFEWKRKFEDLSEKLPGLLEETIKKNLPQQQPQYTEEQLEAFLSDNDSTYHTPQAVGWARTELKKLQEERQANVVRKELGRWREEQERQTKKQQAFNYVASTYPDMFTKDTNGNLMGWNNNHPLTQHLNQIMQNPKLANDPEGLIAAADMAYARYVRGQQSMNSQKEQQLKNEVKQLQKGTLIEGSGKGQIQPVPTHRVLLDKLKKTGSLNDAKEALAAMYKARKASEE